MTVRCKLVSAPVACYLTRVAPTRLLMVLVGCVILFLSLRSLLKFVSWL